MARNVHQDFVQRNWGNREQKYFPNASNLYNRYIRYLCSRLIFVNYPNYTTWSIWLGSGTSTKLANGKMATTIRTQVYATRRTSTSAKSENTK